MQLREYQKEGHRKALKAARGGRRSLVYVMATGGGKSVLASVTSIELAQMFGGKVLWVAHRRELIKQARNTLKKLGIRTGAIAPRMKADPDAPVQVASIQTLRKSGELAIPEGVVVMVWDECHHAVSDDWVLLAKMARKRKIFLLGLTATPERKDGRGLSPLFGTMVVVSSHRKLVQQGHLVPTDILVPDTLLDDGLADLPVRLWEKHAKGTKTVVFCENVDHAIEVAEQFAERGWDADYVEGDMPMRERDRIIKRFVGGRLKILTNCQILTEGFDLPPIQTVILARRIGSHALYLQMVGRGSRPMPGKKRNLVLDLAGNARLYGAPEDERKFSLSGRPIMLRDEDALERRRRCRGCGLIVPDMTTTFCPMCGTPFMTPKARKVHGKVLSRMSVSDRVAYERAALDRLRDYARGHGKDEAWVVERYVKKFGKLP